jgi:hypothetical protein
VLSIATLPVIKALPPSTLYQPEIGPSWEMLAIVVGASIAALAGVVWAWQGRIDWRAPADQQREAERFA